VKTREDGWLYFIQEEGGGPIKIGFANDVHERLMQLQAGNHRRLRVIARMLGDSVIEALLHRMHREDRISGEWFEDSVSVRLSIEMVDNAYHGRASIFDRYEGDDRLQAWLHRLKFDKLFRGKGWTPRVPGWVWLEIVRRGYPNKPW